MKLEGKFIPEINSLRVRMTLAQRKGEDRRFWENYQRIARGIIYFPPISSSSISSSVVYLETRSSNLSVCL